ncbi:MAG: hypothetical protein ACRCSG_03955 [Cellulosilyticaceae bacterium]
MNNIVGELTSTMSRETTNLIQLTHYLKDGIIWIDKQHMLFVDEKTSSAKLIKIYEIN